MTALLITPPERSSLTPSDITAVADLVIAANKRGLDPDARVARFLLGILDLLVAEGIAAYDRNSLALPLSQQGRWSPRDNRQLAIADGRRDASEVLVEWIDESDDGIRLSVLGISGRTYYLCADFHATGPNRVTVGVRRLGSPFSPADAALLRALLNSTAGQLLLADRRATRVDRRQSPRMRQVLAGLKDGRSEKEIAVDLRISRHTVHAYVKQLYRHYHVNSRGDLLRLWIRG